MMNHNRFGMKVAKYSFCIYEYQEDMVIMRLEFYLCELISFIHIIHQIVIKLI